MVKITSKRGRRAPEQPEAGIDIELELLVDDDQQFQLPLDIGQDEDPTQFDEYEKYYKEDWVTQHRQDLHLYDPSQPLRVGAMGEHIPSAAAEIWDGSQWLRFNIHDLCKLLQPKLIDVTIGHTTYQMVSK